jgi:hypothetical protein
MPDHRRPPPRAARHHRGRRGAAHPRGHSPLLAAPGHRSPQFSPRPARRLPARRPPRLDRRAARGRRADRCVSRPAVGDDDHGSVWPSRGRPARRGRRRDDGAHAEGLPPSRRRGGEGARRGAPRRLGVSTSSSRTSPVPPWCPHSAGSGRTAAELQACVRYGRRVKGGRVSEADDGEVSAVERGDFTQFDPLGERDDRGLNRAQRQVGVALDQLGDAVEVRLQVVHQLEPGRPGRRRGRQTSACVPRRRSSSRRTSVTTVAGSSSGPGRVSSVPPALVAAAHSRRVTGGDWSRVGRMLPLGRRSQRMLDVFPRSH